MTECSMQHRFTTRLQPYCVAMAIANLLPPLPSDHYATGLRKRIDGDVGKGRIRKSRTPHTSH